MAGMFFCTQSSLSLRRAWIEITTRQNDDLNTASRSPYGERGLKLNGCKDIAFGDSSLSLRRAWIEILLSVWDGKSNPRRSPYGERGLK